VSEFDAVPGLSYTWSPNLYISNNSIPDPLLYPSVPVNYTIVVSNGICSDTVSKMVDLIDFSGASGADDTLCTGQSVTIGPANSFPGLNYSWSPSGGLSAVDIPNPSASPEVTTTYFLNVSASGSSCAFSDTVTIAVSDPVAPGFGFSEFFGCYGGEVTVSANGNPNYQYAWFTNNGQTGAGGSVTFAVPYDTTIVFNMVVTGDGCTDTLSVSQTFESFETYWGDLIVPNVFTPNDDEVNDCFGPSGAPEGCYFLYVYNRWGALVFDSYKLEKTCWNGKYMKTDNDCVDGVYFWVLEVGREEYHGTVTLSRGN
jgi:gliding motility-associated-like protein